MFGQGCRLAVARRPPSNTRSSALDHRVYLPPVAGAPADVVTEAMIAVSGKQKTVFPENTRTRSELVEVLSARDIKRVEEVSEREREEKEIGGREENVLCLVGDAVLLGVEPTKARRQAAVRG